VTIATKRLPVLSPQARQVTSIRTSTGSLEPGKRADLVVLDRDVLTIDPETIEDTKVLATYLDGRLVHSASPGNAEEDDEDAGKWWDEREARMREWLHRD
jgi:cytosine/adenosine deaminase-related metal-dependent hydrolase